jgi:hypothetical protein
MRFPGSPWLATVMAGTLLCLTGHPALAETETAEATSPTTRRSLIVDLRLGVAMLTRSRSKALGNLIKPDARVGARFELRPGLEIGGAITALIVGSEHYRVLGALAHARYAAWRSARVSLGVAIALGAGYDADILHTSLHAANKLAPYGFIAADGRFRPGAGPWFVGAELAWQNLAMVQLGAAVGRSF